MERRRTSATAAGGFACSTSWTRDGLDYRSGVELKQHEKTLTVMSKILNFLIFFPNNLVTIHPINNQES